MRIKDLSEIDLIRRLSKDFRLDKTVIKGPGDDAAVIKWTKNRYLLYTCDMTIEGVHFDLRKATPFQAGWKALGRNISDIGAMGGVPKYAVVSLAIAPGQKLSVADGICRGLKSIADRFGVNIVGGDMAGSKNIVIDVSLIGEVEKKKLALRSGARIGDVILVTGSLGGSIKGKHLNFMPRVNEARGILKKFKINSMIDISDGLALDLNRILDASRVGACVYESAIPLSRDASLVSNALYDGEDYELLFTMGAEEAKELCRTALRRIGTPVSIIGEITAKKDGCRIVRGDGKVEEMKIKGYLHFKLSTTVAQA
ncbi:MAG: thiamine-phosphate kinase [Candidatus Omnitrophica bacterium]|nr:thiamine-phosphate kinase [Candidatus Omnitrophota bacterium]